LVTDANGVGVDNPKSAGSIGAALADIAKSSTTVLSSFSFGGRLRVLVRGALVGIGHHRFIGRRLRLLNLSTIL